MIPGQRPMNPRGTVGKVGSIYIDDHYTLLHTKYEGLGFVVSETNIFIMPGK